MSERIEGQIDSLERYNEEKMERERVRDVLIIMIEGREVK